MTLLARYLLNLLVSVDQLANTILGGAPDETLSSRMGKARNHCRPCYWICRVLHLLDSRHCERSREPGEGGRAVWRW